MTQQQQRIDYSKLEVFKSAMKGTSGTRVIDTQLFGEGHMLRVSLTVKKPDQQGAAPVAKAFLHLPDARRMKESLLRGDFSSRAFGQSKEKGKYFGQGGSLNKRSNPPQLEAREMTVTFIPMQKKEGTDQLQPRTYPFIVQIKNGKGRKPEGQNDGLVVMDGKPDVDNAYYFTEAEFTEFLDSGIRAWERWKLIQELLDTMGTNLTPQPQNRPQEEPEPQNNTISDDLELSEDDL